MNTRKKKATAALLLFRRKKYNRRYWVHPINQTCKDFGEFHTLYKDYLDGSTGRGSIFGKALQDCSKHTFYMSFYVFETILDVLSKIVKNRRWKKSIEVGFFLVLATLFDHISFNLSLCSNNIVFMHDINVYLPLFIHTIQWNLSIYALRDNIF